MKANITKRKWRLISLIGKKFQHPVPRSRRQGVQVEHHGAGTVRDENRHHRTGP